MILNEQERAKRNKKLEELSKPLVDFLYEYGCPHSTIIITQTSAELTNGECGVAFEPRD